MKAIILSLFLILTTTISLKAQKLIAVQSGENATFYTDLDTAIFYAKNGDFIYLPGGYIKANNATLKIDKAVNIIGVGWDPNATIATGNTIIQSATIEILPSVIGGSISGIYAKNSTLQIQDNVSNFSVNRCYFNYMYIGNTLGNIPPSNIQITETIFEYSIQGNVSANGSDPQNISISNSIIGNSNTITAAFFGNPIWNQLTCKNCIINGNNSTGGYILNNIQNSLFENCVLQYSSGNYYANYNNIFINCLFHGYSAVGPSIVFNCIIEDWNTSIFSPTSYQLRDNSPGKNAGKDGTDIGIYGGRYPWKDGGLPINPHIETFNVGGNTNTNGTLKVNIKVAAQDH